MVRASRSAPGARRARSQARRTGASVSRGPVAVRSATLHDVATLVRHRRAMWEAIGRGNWSQLDRHDRQYRAWMARERAARRFYAFLAEDPDGTILGSGAVWLMPAQPRPDRRSPPTQPYILSMFTEPGARGRGVASALVQRMVDWARARRYPRAVLHASKMGRGVYERLGFERSNEMRIDLTRRGRPVRRR